MLFGNAHMRMMDLLPLDLIREPFDSTIQHFLPSPLITQAHLVNHTELTSNTEVMSSLWEATIQMDT